MKFWLGTKLMRFSKRLERFASWVSPEWDDMNHVHSNMLPLGIQTYNQIKTKVDPAVTEANRILRETE